MRIDAKRWRLLMTICLALGMIAGPAAARDRPGTPNNLEVSDCGQVNGHPAFCGRFTNTASEDVKIEWQITKDGQPAVDNFLIGCPDPRDAGFAGSACILQVVSGSRDVSFEVRSTDFSARYCVQLRARRQSDQVVSEVWSAPACFTTPPMPPPPTAPAVQVQYIPFPQRSTPAIVVTQPPIGPYGSATVQFGNDQPLRNTGNGDWLHEVQQGVPASIPIKVCSINPAGQACSTTTYQYDQPAPKPIHLTGQGPGSPPPAPQAPFTGDWIVTAPAGPFELDMVQFPNNGLRGAMKGAQNGTATGHVTGPTSVHVDFTLLPTRQGEADITLAPDGNHFYGGGQFSDHTTFTWSAVRKPPPGPN